MGCGLYYNCMGGVRRIYQAAVVCTTVDDCGLMFSSRVSTFVTAMDYWSGSLSGDSRNGQNGLNYTGEAEHSE